MGLLSNSCPAQPGSGDHSRSSHLCWEHGDALKGCGVSLLGDGAVGRGNLTGKASPGREEDVMGRMSLAVTRR